MISPFTQLYRGLQGFKQIPEMEAHEMHATKASEIVVEEKFGPANAYPGVRTDGTRQSQTRVRVRVKKLLRLSTG